PAASGRARGSISRSRAVKSPKTLRSTAYTPSGANGASRLTDERKGTQAPAAPAFASASGSGGIITSGSGTSGIARTMPAAHNPVHHQMTRRFSVTPPTPITAMRLASAATIGSSGDRVGAKSGEAAKAMVTEDAASHDDDTANAARPNRM